MQADEIDLAVHSLKDVPTLTPEGLELVAMLERADPRDALLSAGPGLADLPPGAKVGTTSLRRQAQLAAARPDLVLADLRGNVDTRLRRLREGSFDAILLAMAGLVRLGRAEQVTQALDPRSFVPAPGQGTIVLECRGDDGAVREAVAPLHHEPTARAVTAERAFLATLGGGCNVPLGAHATARGERLDLVGFVARVDGSTVLRAERQGDDPVSLGRDLGQDLLDRGAGDLLAP
jgi:hydroxymethylbilane synthase